MKLVCLIATKNLTLSIDISKHWTTLSPADSRCLVISFTYDCTVGGGIFLYSIEYMFKYQKNI